MRTKETNGFANTQPYLSTAFLFNMPGLKTSVHIALYMPTHGKDSEFVSDLADLRNCLDELKVRFSDPTVYIRGDGNVNSNNHVRVTLLKITYFDRFRSFSCLIMI